MSLALTQGHGFPIVLPTHAPDAGSGRIPILANGIAMWMPLPFARFKCAHAAADMRGPGATVERFGVLAGVEAVPGLSASLSDEEPTAAIGPLKFGATLEVCK